MLVTRAMPINDIDGQSCKIELRSSRNYSTNHTKSNSHHKLFKASGKHTHICIKVVSRNYQPADDMPGLKIKQIYSFICPFLFIFSEFHDIFYFVMDMIEIVRVVTSTCA